MKKIKVQLSAENLRKLTEKINTLKNDIEKANKEIVNDLIEVAENEIRNNYGNSPYEDGIEYPSTIGKDDKSAFVQGSQVIYREFGTGTMGLQDSHPKKDQVNVSLNPYNSGPTIRPAGENIKPETGILPR